MSVLTMGNAEFGRDQSQIKVLINDLNTKIDGVLAQIDSNSNEFKNVINTVGEYWVGADATKFIKDFKAKNLKVASDVKTLKSKISTAFYEDEKQFAKFQSSNDIANQ